MSKREIKNIWLLYSLLFAAVCILGYGVVYGTGHTLIGRNDDLSQYYASFLYVGSYIRSFFQCLGREAAMPMFDLSIGMGEDVAGCLNYYGFGDPMYLLSAVAMGKSAPVYFDLLYFLRLYLGGAAFIYYCQEMDLKKLPSVMGAIGYLFTSFGISAVSKIPAWGCVFIFLPLMLTGCERVFKGRGGKWLLVFSAFYAGLCGFYMIYMTGVFLAVYCLCRSFIIKGKSAAREALFQCIICGLYVLLGLMLSMPFLLPAIIAFLKSERSDSSILEIITDWHNYVPNIRFIKETFKYPFSGNVYFSGVSISELAAAFLLIFAKKTRGIKQCIIALVTALLTFSLPITGYVFNGFGESYTRWAVFIHFIFAIVFTYVLSKAEFHFDSAKWFKKLIVLLLVAVPVNAAVNGVSFFSDLGSGRIKALAERAHIDEYMDSPVVNSWTIADDKGLYRVSAEHYMSINSRPENNAMLHGYNGLTYWFSMVNGYTQESVNRMLDSHENWRSFGMGQNVYPSTMAGVKYYVCPEEMTVPKEYEVREVYDFGSQRWKLLENLLYYGFSYLRPESELLTECNDKASYEEHFKSIYEDYIAGHESVSETYDNRACEYYAWPEAADNSLLVTAFPYSDSWQAWVDGVRAEVVRVDGMYIGIPVSDGKHQVRLKYVPYAFYAGCVMAVIALMVILGVVFVNKPSRVRLQTGKGRKHEA